MIQRENFAMWQARATPIGQLLAEVASTDAVREVEKLADLATRVARSVLVAPSPLSDVNVQVEHLLRAETPTARVAVLNLINALQCAGAIIRPDIEANASRALVELVGVGPPLALRVSVGFAAIVYGEPGLVARIVPEIPTVFYGNDEFPNNVLALLAYASARSRAGAGTLDAAWRRLTEELAPLCASGQLDEPAVLWIARAVYQHFGGNPVASVAALAHEYLLADHQACHVPPEPEFPLMETLANGAYRIERHLRGHGSQSLWLAVEVATGAPALVACDVHTSEKQNIAALRHTVSYQCPGVFDLTFVGTFDATGSDRRRDAIRTGQWAIVEKVTAGSWLPWLIGPADPWTAPAKAVQLGLSAGRLLVRAVAAGIDVARIRPELMWAERRDGHITVTGLSPRATELFARKVGEMVTHPVFDRFYHAPEIYEDPDDRAFSYSLAVMMAEWATGRYPFASLYAPNGLETGVHEPIDTPRPLARLLEASIRLNRNERPRLRELVAELEGLKL